MKQLKFFWIITVICLFFTACSKGKDGGAEPYYVRKMSAGNNGFAHSTSTYEYDDQKRLLRVNTVGVDAGGMPVPRGIALSMMLMER